MSNVWHVGKLRGLCPIGAFSPRLEIFSPKLEISALWRMLPDRYKVEILACCIKAQPVQELLQLMTATGPLIRRNSSLSSFGLVE